MTTENEEWTEKKQQNKYANTRSNFKCTDTQQFGVCTKHFQPIQAERNVEIFYKREITHLFSECEKKKIASSLILILAKWFALSHSVDGIECLWLDREEERVLMKKTNAQQQQTAPATNRSQLFFVVCFWCLLEDFFCYVFGAMHRFWLYSLSNLLADFLKLQ